jgi:SAM-dependent methyltransferase
VTPGDCQSTYDRVADEYVRRIADELRDKPFDRELLDRFAAIVGDGGLACDMGCGPGHIARYLRERGAAVCGVDLSAEMVQRARQLNPGVEFQQGDMLALDVPDGVWAGIAAFYSIIHISPGDLPRALGELHRALQPGGRLLLAFHLGSDVLHLDEWWGHEVNVDFFLYRSDEMADGLRSAGLEVTEILERDAYPDIEYQGRRAYIFARKPLSAEG